LKAAVPDLAARAPEEAVRRLRRLLAVSRRIGLVGSVRAVEQTPEVAFLVEAVALAYPEARVIHLVRDGRDVVCSLLERGWLSAGRSGEDDAGIAFGPHARFWVEEERRAEFARASDARRAAWAWRRYVTAARSAGPLAHEVRYERMAQDPVSVAAKLAGSLGVRQEPLREALGRVHSESVGRYRRELAPGELADVLDEAGDLLRDLGYLEPD
jgi:hypothetical protein